MRGGRRRTAVRGEGGGGDLGGGDGNGGWKRRRAVVVGPRGRRMMDELFPRALDAAAAALILEVAVGGLDGRHVLLGEKETHQRHSFHTVGSRPHCLEALRTREADDRVFSLLLMGRQLFIWVDQVEWPSSAATHGLAVGLAR